MKLWKIFLVFTQEKGKILTHKNFELYEVQWSRLLHLWSSKEATGDEKKGREKVQWSWNGLLPIFSKFESQYSKLYCDTGLDRHGLGDRPGHAAGAKGHARGVHG